MSDSRSPSYAKLLEEPDQSPAEAPPSIPRLVESLLFAGGEPLSAERASHVLRGLTEDQFQATVQSLAQLYRRQNRPYSVQSNSQGYYLALRPAFRSVRERLTGSPREARLAQPALDVLSVIAYKQPITKAEVESLLGSDSAATLRQLVRLGLAAVLPKAQTGMDGAFATTRRFLDLFGLKNLDDLPRTSDLQKI